VTTIDPALLLPARPGLLVPECPVADLAGQPCLVTWAHDVRAWVVRLHPHDPDGELTPAGSLSLDLSQRAGRARAAKWLAERYKLACSPRDACSTPRWRADFKAWTLSWRENVESTQTSFAADIRGFIPGRVHEVPALAELPDDYPWTPDNDAKTRLLADGSCWIDARALVLCCEAAPL
jgi:hypothetical protein